MELESSNMPFMRKVIANIDHKWKTVNMVYNIASFVVDNFLHNCPKSTLFAVFDGHGGKIVSQRLINLLPNVSF